jgi:flagellar L-ring protein FlgH
MSPTTSKSGPFGRFLALTILVGWLLVGCASPTPVRDWTPAMPPEPPAPDSIMANGAIYQAGTAIALFEDVKAHRVGDTLTIQLAERTNAQTSASTSTQKDNSADIANPSVFGRGVTHNGLPLFQGSMGATREFDGQGSSSQSNQLDGNITVTVHRRLPNGNLMVRGEKWITINQGREYLRVAGIVRPADIAPNNTIPSWKLADAQIEYSGTGALADANRQGLLARFFMWPFTLF